MLLRKRQCYLRKERFIDDSNCVAFAGELYSRVSGQHLSSGLLCPEAAETEPPDQLQFPKGQEERPVARQAARQTETPGHQCCPFTDNVQTKLSEGWTADGAWMCFPPSGGKNSWATTNLFFSIIKELKVIQLSDLIHRHMTDRFWSFVVVFLSWLWQTAEFPSTQRQIIKLRCDQDYIISFKQSSG